jgi:hypothetical protein
MWEQLEPWLKEQGRRLLQGLGAVLLLLARGLRAAWVLIRPSIVFALNVLVALLLLFEEWGWRPLSNLVAQLARFRIWALTELWIAGLPPYGALVALGIPSAILIPAKLFGVYLLALGHVVTAAVVLIAAKLASTALIARIFLLTKPALMQIGWFQRAYDLFVPWQEALFAWIRASWVWRYGRVVKWRVGGTLRRTWKRLRPQLAAAWAHFEPRAMALMRRLRLRGREIWGHAALAGGRLLRRLQGPHG